MKLSRRRFIEAIGLISVGVGRARAQSETSNRPRKAARSLSEGAGGPDPRTTANDAPAVSRIRVAQIKVYPEKGELSANHEKLMSVLGDVAKNTTSCISRRMTSNMRPANVFTRTNLILGRLAL